MERINEIFDDKEKLYLFLLEFTLSKEDALLGYLASRGIKFGTYKIYQEEVLPKLRAILSEVQIK